MEKQLKLESVEPSELTQVGGGGPILVAVILGELFAGGFLAGYWYADIKARAAEKALQGK
jgi:hypothetical protein